MRVVYAEDAYALFDPVQHHAAQFLAQLAAVFIFEIQRVDILVLFGRVFGILHAAVRPHVEPFLALQYVGMVRRALESNI